MKDILYAIIKFISRIIVMLLNKYVIMFVDMVLKNITTEYTIKKLNNHGKDISISFPITVVGHKYISIGDNFNTFSRLRLEAFDKHLNNIYTPEIIIGKNVSINYDCHVGCVNKIVIGNNVLIGSKVFITDHYHGKIDFESLKTPPSLRKVISKGPVIIEDNVWIGEGVAIMPNVTIGENAIIGANAVVTKNIPSNAVVAGVPAVIIKLLGE